MKITRCKLPNKPYTSTSRARGVDNHCTIC